MRVTEYVLTEEFKWDVGAQDQRILPAGTFVKPVDPRYVPDHVKAAWSQPSWYSDRVFAYTRYGFIYLPQTLLRALE